MLSAVFAVAEDSDQEIPQQLTDTHPLNVSLCSVIPQLLTDTHPLNVSLHSAISQLLTDTHPLNMSLRSAVPQQLTDTHPLNVSLQSAFVIGEPFFPSKNQTFLSWQLAVLSSSARALEFMNYQTLG